MAPPFVFSERDWRYKLGTGILLLATIFAVFGVICPGWYSVTHVQTGDSGYSHLWIFCSDGLKDCSVLGSSNTRGFEKATQALVMIGLLLLLAACFLGVFLNFVTHSRAHNRWLEISAFVGGGVIFLGGVVFVGAGSSYIPDSTSVRIHPIPLDRYTLSFGYAVVMTFVSAILATASGLLLFVFNRPLVVPSDVRSLSALRNADPVESLHQELGGDGDRGFQSATRDPGTWNETAETEAFRDTPHAPSLSNPPPDWTEVTLGAHPDIPQSAHPRSRFPSRGGGGGSGSGGAGCENVARLANGEEFDDVSGDLGLPSQQFQFGKRNPGYVVDPGDDTDHNHNYHNDYGSSDPPSYASFHEYEVLRRDSNRHDSGLRENATRARGHDSAASRGGQRDPRHSHGVTSRNTRHQVPTARHTSPMRHVSDGRRGDDFTERRESRHSKVPYRDDVSDDAGFAPGYRQEPRHYNDERRNEPEYRPPRYPNDDRQNNRTEIDSDAYMQPRYMNRPRYDERRIREVGVSLDGVSERNVDREPRHLAGREPARQLENVTDRKRGNDERGYDATGVLRQSRLSDNVSDSDVDVPVGVAPPPYTSTQV